MKDLVKLAIMHLVGEYTFESEKHSAGISEAVVIRGHNAEGTTHIRSGRVHKNPLPQIWLRMKRGVSQEQTTGSLNAASSYVSSGQSPSRPPT